MLILCQNAEFDSLNKSFINLNSAMLMWIETSIVCTCITSPLFLIFFIIMVIQAAYFQNKQHLFWFGQKSAFKKDPAWDEMSGHLHLRTQICSMISCNLYEWILQELNPNQSRILSYTVQTMGMSFLGTSSNDAKENIGGFYQSNAFMSLCE